MALTRRVLLVACVLGLSAACTSTGPPAGSAVGGQSGGQPTTVASADPAKADAVRKIVRDSMTAMQPKAVITRVTVDGKEILTQAFGESMTGVPATVDMHFRNGSVAISYVATVLLELVDEKKVSLDDKLAKWLPDMPHADQVTLGQLAQMTTGYVDYVLGNTEFDAAHYADLFRNWTPEQLLSYAVQKPLFYPPGTNWNYAHTNYVILGLALEKVTGKPMAALIKEKVLDPLGLANTVAAQNAPIPEPVLHAFSSERRQALKVPDGTPFYEESTFWDPSWTITRGAIETTNIFDLNTTAVGIGSGKLLSPQSYQAMVSTNLRGKTTALPGCPTCAPQSDFYTYGLGVVTTGHWLIQNPLLSGYAAVEAYLPSQKIAISVATTFNQAAFDTQGNYQNAADSIFREIGALLAPHDAPPPRPAK